MKPVLFILFSLFFGRSAAFSQTASGPDRVAFYEAMSSSDPARLDKEIKNLAALQFSAKDAFTGALEMKKAGLVKGVKNKLNLFKAGHKKLEAAIGSDSKNTELRFLRLMIQENAPKTLGYNKDIQSDVSWIKEHFSGLSSPVQQAIRRYSKTSTVLPTADL